MGKPCDGTYYAEVNILCCCYGFRLLSLVTSKEKAGTPAGLEHFAVGWHAGKNSRSAQGELLPIGNTVVGRVLALVLQYSACSATLIQ